MKLKGLYTQKYTLDKEQKELVVRVELKQIDGLMKAGQNVWFGIATANGKEIKHPSLAYCVNAESMSERIGLEIIEAWKTRAKKEGKSFRLKESDMKAKTLRFKDTKEYVHIENYGGEPMVCSGELPNLHPITATIDLMKQIAETEEMEELFDFENMEFVEVDVIESGVVGADIRNKLTPPLNLLSLLKLYFNETKEVEKQTLMKIIEKEMKQCEKSIKYIANLL